MHRFRNVLFSPLTTSGNPAALRRLANTIDRDNAALRLVGVIAEPTGIQRLIHRHELIDEAVEAQIDRLAASLESWLRQASLVADTSVTVGDPALRIIEQVINGGHDLVVVTSDEDREDQATLRRLLRKCPCPVWVVRPSRARTRRVLAAVNPDPHEIELNRTILELAAATVRAGGELHVVHAWQIYGESKLRGSAFRNTPQAAIDDLNEVERSGHAAMLDELLANSIPDDQPTVHLIKGSPIRVVPDLIAKKRINTLVIGTVARHGASAMIMGNTAENILDNVACSVIAVKPPGFTSPIVHGRR